MGERNASSRIPRAMVLRAMAIVSDADSEFGRWIREEPRTFTAIQKRLAVMPELEGVDWPRQPCGWLGEVCEAAGVTTAADQRKPKRPRRAAEPINSEPSRPDGGPIDAARSLAIALRVLLAETGHASPGFLDDLAAHGRCDLEVARRWASGRLFRGRRL